MRSRTAPAVLTGTAGLAPLSYRRGPEYAPATFNAARSDTCRAMVERHPPMSSMASLPINRGTTFGSRYVSPTRRRAGRMLVVAATFALAAMALLQALYDAGSIGFGF